MTATTEEQIIIEAELTAARSTDACVDVADAAPASESTANAAVDTTAASPDAIRIVKGNPTDAEIAALVSVLAAAAATAPAEGDGTPPETWGDPTRMHRQWAPFSPYSYPSLG